MPPSQTVVQVVPAAQANFFPPLQSMVHEPPSPHATMHAAAPPHFEVHPPLGQLMVQVLLPVQSSVEPEPMSIVHALPPEHVTLESAPASSEQSLVPAHDATHPALQVPTHVDWPSHTVVQPEPQATLHVFCCWQS